MGHFKDIGIACINISGVFKKWSEGGLFLRMSEYAMTLIQICQTEPPVGRASYSGTFKVVLSEPPFCTNCPSTLFFQLSSTACNTSTNRQMGIYIFASMRVSARARVRVSVSMRVLVRMRVRERT